MITANYFATFKLKRVKRNIITSDAYRNASRLFSIDQMITDIDPDMETTSP